jgi:hypothetical protein
MSKKAKMSKKSKLNYPIGIGFEFELSPVFADCNTPETPHKYENKKVFYKKGKTTFTSDSDGGLPKHCFVWEAQIGVFDNFELTGFDDECEKITHYLKDSPVHFQTSWNLFYTNTSKFLEEFEETNDTFFIDGKDTIKFIIESIWTQWPIENLDKMYKIIHDILEKLEKRNFQKELDKDLHENINIIARQLMTFSPDYYTDIVLLGKPQMTLSFHISKYFLAFLLYYLRNDSRDEKTCIRLLHYVLLSVIDQKYKSNEPLKEASRLMTESKIREAFNILKIHENSLEDELSILGFVLYTSYYFYNLQKYKTLEEVGKAVPYFKALFSIKPRTSILDIFYYVNEIKTFVEDFKFDFISDLITWDITPDGPTRLYAEILSGKNILKIGKFELPRDAIFEFIGIDIGGPGHVAVEFRNFRKLVNLFGGNPELDTEIIHIEDFRRYSHQISVNFITPIVDRDGKLLFRKRKSTRKNKKSIMKSTMKLYKRL